MNARPIRCLLAALALLASSAAGSPAQRYQPVEVYIDSGDAPLAAYQVEVTIEGDAMIVGVEGGDAPAFAPPPHYDPRALAGGRIIIADLDVGSELPRGRTRVATLHMRETGAQPTYRATLQAAADADGTPIPAIVRLEVDRGDPA
ncbi:hypothetical protein KF840_20185 [bacterium]|nr:hypothetical protein [bacterium]